MQTADEVRNNLKSVVSSFRLSELQELLTSLGRNKNGQKRQLVERVHHIIDGDCSSAVQTKIRSLAERMRMENSQRHWNDHVAPFAAHSSYQSNVLAASSMYQHTPYMPCTITFAKLPFYDFINPIMQAVKLTNAPNSRTQINEVRFTLTQAHVAAIKSACSRAAGGEINYQVQVQLRFCIFVPQSTDQPDSLPPNLAVKVNNENVTLPQPKPCRPTEEPKRPGLPIDITRHVHLRPGDSNMLVVTWSTTQQVREYAIIISLVHKRTPEELLQRLREKGSRSMQLGRELLMRNFNGDSDLAVSTQVVSLTCPLSMVRVSIPLRSNNCRHVQCFDALTFLRMNEKKPTWVCPACSQPAPFSQLAIDDFLTDILRRAKSNEVVFDPSGSWKENEQETNVLSDSDDEDFKPPKPAFQPPPPQPPAPKLVERPLQPPLVPKPVERPLQPAERPVQPQLVLRPSMLEPQNLSIQRSQNPPVEQSPISPPVPVVTPLVPAPPPQPAPAPVTAAPPKASFPSAPPPISNPLRNIMSEQTSRAFTQSPINQTEAHTTAVPHSSSGHSHGHAKCPRCSGHRPAPIRLPADMPTFIDLTASDDEQEPPARPPPSRPNVPPVSVTKTDVETSSKSNSADLDEVIRPSRRRQLSEDDEPILFETASTSSGNKRRRFIYNDESSSSDEELEPGEVEPQNEHETTPPTDPSSLNEGPSSGAAESIFENQQPVAQPSNSNATLPSISSKSTSLSDLLQAPQVRSSEFSPQQQMRQSTSQQNLSLGSPTQPNPSPSMPSCAVATTSSSSTSRPVITSITSLAKLPPPPQQQPQGSLHPPTLQLNHQSNIVPCPPSNSSSSSNSSRYPSASTPNNVAYQPRFGAPPAFQFADQAQLLYQQHQLQAYAQMAAAACTSNLPTAAHQPSHQGPPIAHASQQPTAQVDPRRYILQQQQQQQQQQLSCDVRTSTASTSGRMAMPANNMPQNPHFASAPWLQSVARQRSQPITGQSEQSSPPPPPLYPLNEQQIGRKPQQQQQQQQQQQIPQQIRNHSTIPLNMNMASDPALPLYALPPVNPAMTMPTSGNVGTPPPLQLFHPR